MVDIKNKQILIDGKPVIITCGEIHYYRLEKEEWQDRIDKLKESGCNAVASYVPWICHEPVEGEFDVDGRTRPELNIGDFIDLCQENNLYFFVRPGPFIMAEMKNEGIPFWVYEKYPEVVPIGWDHNPAATKTLDYLAPNFLHATKKWYEVIMEIIKPRLQTNGGNIIGVQLDNEIGMLSWVSNTPDLTEYLIEDFVKWLKEKYDINTLSNRYPFNLEDYDSRIQFIRSPREEYTSELHFDLGYYMRNRFARYVSELRRYCEEFGVKNIPFVINIHGTGGGRGFTYPIGISQLYESYTQAPGYISGSDIYFGNLNMDSFQDLYLINGFMDAVHNEDQPLTSVEFACGDANYGETFAGRLDVSAVDFKHRMCIAQGNRLINYYLMTGGRNYRLDQKVNDGNDRVAFTGERHGFAAPISPEGELNYTYPRMARGIKTVMAVAEKIATMNEELDNVSFAFIPDYYMTESRYPKSEKMKEIYSNIEMNRSYGAWEIMGRAMLLAGYRFSSIDIQNKPLDPEKNNVIVLPSAKYLHKYIQQKLAEFVNAGGSLLIYGQLPLFDMEGNECTILIDALGLKYTGDQVEERYHYLSIYPNNWALPRPEVRSNRAQTFKLTNGEPVFHVYGSDTVCGFDVNVGKGRVIAFTMSYRCDIDLFKTALEKLGASPKLTHDFIHHGIFMTSTVNEENERFIHILNLDDFDKQFHLNDNGTQLFEGRNFTLNSKDGVMLPINVNINGILIEYATAEIQAINDHSIQFRITQAEDVIKLHTKKEILPSNDFKIEKQGESILVKSTKHGKVDDQLKIYFQ
ncbi:beta-galactosidase [Gottfriedia acidiceleris]|uniref:beta-galactosidase n=1 Tax=Gottfriedia acidiceleris TaxID=371036 RepID=UPI002FFDC09D